MKKFLYYLAAVALAVSWGMAQAGVEGSKHDLTSATGTGTNKTTGTTEICVFCHTPHGGDQTAGPLWNRSLTSASGFTMYSSSTIDMTIASGGPQGVSLACLSCHDGTIAFDVLINAPSTTSSYNYTAGGADQGWTWTSGTGDMSALSIPPKFGTDLSNQHPISVTYDTSKDTAFNAAVSGKVGTLPLYGGSSDQVECGTCHNPHDTTNVAFLRISNANSDLCLTCHVK